MEKCSYLQFPSDTLGNEEGSAISQQQYAGHSVGALVGLLLEQRECKSALMRRFHINGSPIFMKRYLIKSMAEKHSSAPREPRDFPLLIIHLAPGNQMART